jgi:glucose-6-phosphate 1-dehydrogenase
MLSFQTADVTQVEDVSSLFGDDRPDTLVYLALPPSLFEPVLTALAGSTLRRSDAVAIEKPFGNDLASAQHLNEILRLRLPEPTIFRIDHFLSNELVRRVVALRFLNRVFEPIWNAAHIESARGDEAEESWRIMDPVMKAWATGQVPMQEYTAGEAPPNPIY